MNPVASFWIAHLAFCEAQWHNGTPDPTESQIGERHLVTRSLGEAARLLALNEHIKRDVAARLTPEADALARIEAASRWWSPVKDAKEPKRRRARSIP